MSDNKTETKGFGTGIQQFSVKFNSAFSKYSITPLEDGKYTSWRPTVYEAIRGLGFHPFLSQPSYDSPSFTDEENEQVKFLLTSWILNQCDDVNANRARTHLKTRLDGTQSIDPEYDLSKIWTFLNSHHALITESKLTHIDAALHTVRQNRSDDLHTHIDKFTALLNDYYEYEGVMATSQASRTLLRSLKPGYELTVKFIYRTIKPLTLEAVKKELLESEDEDKFETEAMAQVNYANHSTNASNSNTEANASKKFCTEDNCIGQSFKFPHEPKDCFKKPHNFNKRDKWIAEQEET